MRFLAIALSATMLSCAYNPVRVVSLRYQPSRSGTLAMDHGNSKKWVKLARESASNTMKNFCAPQLPEIVEISNQSTPVGSTTVPLAFGIQQTNTNFASAQFVHFQCVDSSVAKSLFDE